MLAADTHPLTTQWIKRYLTSYGFDDAAWRAWQTQSFSTGLHTVEQRLASEGQTGRFCYSDAVTMADIVLMSIIVVTRIFKIEIAGTPMVNRIAALCKAQDAFAVADPMRWEGAQRTWSQRRLFGSVERRKRSIPASRCLMVLNRYKPKCS